MRIVSILAAAVALCGCGQEGRIRDAIAKGSGTVDLPGGTIALSKPLEIAGVSGLILRGRDNTRLVMQFEGEAAIVIRKSKNVRLENFALMGNRSSRDFRFGLTPDDQPMARWNKNNGVLVEDSEAVTIDRVSIREIVSYPILVSRSRDVAVVEAFVGDSGTLDGKGQNNATGGILFEEGCERFSVRQTRLRNIRGNGIWTHSLYKSPRNRAGLIAENDLRYVGRDALQAGHAEQMRITANTGGFIGFPAEVVDMERGAVPVAIDTAGDVSGSVYAGNHFEEVNGKCIDLDGFHDGVVEKNECVNRRGYEAYPHGHFAIVLNNSNPDMESKGIEIVSNMMTGFRFGGLFLIGQGHVVKNNVFRRINLAQCNENKRAGCLYKADEPDLLQTGIYLGKGAHRPSPAVGNLVENNTVQGHRMKDRCVGPAAALGQNTVKGNRCED